MELTNLENYVILDTNHIFHELLSLKEKGLFNNYRTLLDDI